MSFSEPTSDRDIPTKKNPRADHRQIDRDKLSPMFQHYVDVKEQYPNALLVYRVGDFFECYFEDAVTIARELEKALFLQLLSNL